MTTKKTHAELAAARAREDWNTLWVAAMPLVQQVVSQLCRREHTGGIPKSDLIQEGNVQIGASIRTWNPVEATFGTWIATNVRGHLMRMAAAERFANNRATDTDPSTLPDDKPALDLDVEHVRQLLNLLGEDDRELVARAYGIGRPEESIYQIASATGMHPTTIMRWLEEALAKLRKA